MKHLLRKMVELASFDVLQRKLEKWLDAYSYNTCDENVEKCLEIIELNSGVQARLFELLQMSASEGGRYGGSEALKHRLLPWLRMQAGVISPSSGPTIREDTGRVMTLAGLADKEPRSSQKKYGGGTLDDLEDDLEDSKTEAQQMREELQEKTEELDSLLRKSTAEKISTESEIQQLRDRIRFLESDLRLTQKRDLLFNSRENEIQQIKDEMRHNSPTRRSAFTDGFDRAANKSPSLVPSGDNGPYFSIGEMADRRRQQRAIDAFNELSVGPRREAEQTLRRFTDDEHNVRRILFVALQESFSIARVAFLNYKMRVRSTLAPLLTGAESLQMTIQDYINRNSDAYNLTHLVSSVVRSLGRRVGVFLPPEISCSIVLPFIREACKVSWTMNSLPNPIEMIPAASFELYDSSRYRRSYDSDYDAGLITYHIWPCLMQGHRVLVKGEVYTTNASTALQESSSRVRSPIRSSSPLRLNGEFNRSSSSQTARSSSPLSPRSRRRAGINSFSSGEESRTGSSSLSHYGAFG